MDNDGVIRLNDVSDGFQEKRQILLKFMRFLKPLIKFPPSSLETPIRFPPNSIKYKAKLPSDKIYRIEIFNILNISV